MESKRFGGQIVLRLDENDELISSVEQTCRECGVTSARVNGIGALKEAQLRVLNQTGDGFCYREVQENMEITGINGNVTQDGDGLMIHLHLAAAGEDFSLVGGHVMRCVITNTAELWITPIEGGSLKRARQAQGLLRKIEFEEESECSKKSRGKN